LDTWGIRSLKRLDATYESKDGSRNTQAVETADRLYEVPTDSLRAIYAEAGGIQGGSLEKKADPLGRGAGRF